MYFNYHNGFWFKQPVHHLQDKQYRIIWWINVKPQMIHKLYFKDNENPRNRTNKDHTNEYTNSTTLI